MTAKLLISEVTFSQSWKKYSIELEKLYDMQCILQNKKNQLLIESLQNIAGYTNSVVGFLDPSQILLDNFHTTFIQIGSANKTKIFSMHARLVFIQKHGECKLTLKLMILLYSLCGRKVGSNQI
jgi:hypothetical protein